VLGFIVVIAAFVTAGTVAMRSTRQATADVARFQEDLHSLTRSARDLGNATAAFDRAVLTYLRTGSEELRTDAADAAARLSATASGVLEAERGPEAGQARALLEQISRHQADGFELLRLHERRTTAVAGLEEAYASLDRHITAAGGRGVRVGEDLLSRPTLAELAQSLEAARNEAARDVALGVERPSTGNERESRFRASLQDHASELAGSPGRAWVSLVNEDFARAVEQRKRIQQLDVEIESLHDAFGARGDALAARIREDVEAPAWAEFEAAAEGARQAVANAEDDIGGATLKALLLTVLALLVTGLMITLPVRRLTAGTRRLAAGELTTRVRRGGASELDELARAFNHMAQELDTAERAVKSYQAQLEQRVEERTLQLRHLAEHDPLTNLPNRRQLFQRLNEMIEAADRDDERLAVLFVDLDNFKTVNDSLGHEFGDRVLTEIGERLRLLSGETGFIARLGGDEFTLIFRYTGLADEIEHRAKTLVSSFQRPLHVDRREISIGVSCGAAVFPEHGWDATSLLRAADAALFRAKELGRNQLCIYDPSLLVAASNRFRIEQALRKSVEGGEFVLYYQPQVCLGRRETNAVEALLRWRQGDRIVPAGEFIAIAEQSGLLLDLNAWVFEQAARDVSKWRREGWPQARVAVNVSAQQIVAGDFLGDFERLLTRYGLPPDAIEIELTETVLQTGAITVETLRGLRLLGVTTTLDDFGTGYSSLTSLEQLPLSRVKLDRSVVAEVDWNPRAAAIARSIIGLCRSLSLEVTVEGIERPSQLDFLSDCGAVSVQGYLIAQPSPDVDAMEFVRRTPARVEALLQAAELSRTTPPSDIGPGGKVQLLRRRRP
jgi:diguanylate cyclase (GGDEF)-like protein